MKHIRMAGRMIGILLLAALLLTACGQRDEPPSDGTPDPPALSGTYRAEGGTLTFNGDGKTIAFELEAALAEAAGLPAGRQEGQYVFLFRNEMWRYDKAESFRIILADGNRQYRNAPGDTDGSTVAVYLIDGADAVRFVRESG